MVTAKLMTGFDAPNEGVLYLDKPMKAHTLFQTITRPNRTWMSPAGFVKTSGVVVDYIGLAEEVQRAVTDPTAGEEDAGKGGGFVTDLSDLVAEFRTTFARIEDLLADVDDLDLTVHGYESVRAINAFLDSDPAAAEAFARDYRLLARLYPLISTDKRVAKYRDGFGLFGSVYTTLFKKSSDEETEGTAGRARADGPGDHQCPRPLLHRRRLPGRAPRPGRAGHRDPQGAAGPRAAQGQSRTTRGQGAAVGGGDPGRHQGRPRRGRRAGLGEVHRPRRADAASCGTGSSRTPRTPWTSWPRHCRSPAPSSTPPGTPTRPSSLDDDHVGVLSRIIRDHAPAGLTVTERNLAEEIDQVVTRTLARPWDNADARSRGVRRATAAVFRRYTLKPVGEPYDSTVAYIEAHYLVD